MVFVGTSWCWVGGAETGGWYDCDLYSSEGAGGGGIGDGDDTGGGASDDVSKQYSESVDCNKTPGQIISDMESNFAGFANYSGTFGPAGLPLAAASVFFTGSVALGSTISITNVNTFLNPLSSVGIGINVQSVAVKVTSVTSNSFTFTTLPGHVLYPATITFAATAENSGQLGFSITVNGDFSNFGNAALYYAGGSNLENNIWNNVLGNVKIDCSH